MVMSNTTVVSTVPSVASTPRKPIRLCSANDVTSTPPDSDSLPVIITPCSHNADLIAWVESNRRLLENHLATAGGVVFRGFNTTDQVSFERFLDAIGLTRMHYIEGATPRTEMGNQIYTSTEFPPEHAIALHNELSYAITWPMKIFFFCTQPAETGGATPIADVRKVLLRIDPAIRRGFIERGWMLVRNFGTGLSLPWEKVFRTSDRQELRRYCESARMECEWKTETWLTTTQRRPAITRHPTTSEELWFNHIAFWHISSLDRDTRELFVADFGERGVPYNTYYGDGAPIEDSVVDEIRCAYQAETKIVPWLKGDILCLDNMLSAHGRQPYTGKRKVLAAMGAPHVRTDF